MFNNQKKSEVVYCRFRSGIYDLVKARAKTWDVSNADAIERLAFIGEIATWAVEQIMGQNGQISQGPARCETEQLLDEVLGPVRKI